MAFVIKLLFLTAIAYNVNAGVLTGHHSDDSFLSSALDSPSANFGPPSTSYGPPDSAVDISGPGASAEGSLLADDQSSGAISNGHIGDVNTFSNGPDLSSGPGDAGIASSGLSAGTISSGASAFGSGGLEGVSIGGPVLGNNGGAILDTAFNVGTTAVGPPRVIGTAVTVSRGVPTASRYELQSVVQNVVRRIPIEVTRHVQVAIPQPVPVPVRQEIRVPVPQPYPVHVDVVKHVPYPVHKTEHVEVERPVPVEVVKHVPFEVIRKVHVPVERPYEVIKKIHVPVEKHVEVPVPVWKPYPIHIIKHVTHYKKKSCCW
ncbi:unnamed protein product [Parnassius apollo]|uniref:(apollo) hypothetical protein n=1 Tax=Parnassius apollo TaxID=110799 RepID=A0A8S3X4A3_PARAO|nr:unnamed protein product [Parnassius apollo]